MFSEVATRTKQDGMDNRQRAGTQKCGVAPMKAESFGKAEQPGEQVLRQE
jgi:hypothetical protein